jgi:hypothetical protein
MLPVYALQDRSQIPYRSASTPISPGNNLSPSLQTRKAEQGRMITSHLQT